MDERERDVRGKRKWAGGKVFVGGEGRAGDLVAPAGAGAEFGSEKAGGKAGCDKRDSDTQFC